MPSCKQGAIVKIVSIAIKMWFFTFILLSSFIYLSGAEIHQKIANGAAIDISEAPYTISVRYYTRHFCGGTIIHAKYVLTAAHSMHALSKDVEGLTIVAGQTKLSDTDGQEISVAKIISNPNFNTITYDYDVAVLELAEELKWNPNVQPLPLSKNKAPAFRSLTITGWGTTELGGAFSDQLLRASVRVQLNSACQLQYSSLRITDRMFCAGHIFGGQDACQGDYGGPAVFEGKLVGLIMIGGDCGKMFAPWIYTQVSSVREFILKTIA